VFGSPVIVNDKIPNLHVLDGTVKLRRSNLQKKNENGKRNAHNPE